MAVLDRMLPKLKSEGHRVVLFSQFNGSLDCLEDYLVMRGYTFRWGSHTRQWCNMTHLFDKQGMTLTSKICDIDKLKLRSFCLLDETLSLWGQCRCVCVQCWGRNCMVVLL